RGPRALRALDLGGRRRRRAPWGDDVRGLVGGTQAPRPHERSRVPGHHRGAAARDGLALASVSAVKPWFVGIEVGVTAKVSYTVGAGQTAHGRGYRGARVVDQPIV